MINLIVSFTDPANTSITLLPGTTNTTNTDLTLYGYGTKFWGEKLNTNLVRMLEHFACPQIAPNQPMTGSGVGINHPIKGQLWFNTTDSELYVYTGSAWKKITSDVVFSEVDGIDLTGAANGEVLTYNSGTGQWESQPLPSGSTISTLNGLTDTNLSGVTNGQYLKYDSGQGKWVPSTLPTGVTTLSGLTDTTLSSVANGQVLTYNSGINKWVNQTLPTGVTTLQGLTDTNIPTNMSSLPNSGAGSVLTYSAGQWIPLQTLATLLYVTNSSGGFGISTGDQGPQTFNYAVSDLWVKVQYTNVSPFYNSLGVTGISWSTPKNQVTLNTGTEFKITTSVDPFVLSTAATLAYHMQHVLFYAINASLTTDVEGWVTSDTVPWVAGANATFRGNMVSLKQPMQVQSPWIPRADIFNGVANISSVYSAYYDPLVPTPSAQIQFMSAGTWLLIEHR